MRRLSLLVLPLLAALTFLGWWLPNRPQASDVAMAAERFNSVSFAPFRAGQSPLTDRFPSAAEVEADVALVATRVRAIRSYAAIEGNYDLAAIAQRHGLKVWLGCWLGADLAQNERELARLIEIANRYPDTVERVVVGNEVLLRRDLPPERLIAAIDRVKAAVRQPVTYADVWEFWVQFPQVAAHVDIVTIHILPYWEDEPTNIPAAMAHVRDVFHRIRALFPEKPVAIGEAGWPSRGRWRDDAAPSRVNQAIFLRQFIALAAAEGFDYNFIEAFDQLWKYKNEGTVGAAWGLWTADRAEKFPLRGGVVENPDWWRYAAAAVLLGVLFWLAAGRRGPPALAVLAMALGNALAFAWCGTVPYIFDDFLYVCAAVNLLGQALLAWLLLRHVASGTRLPERSGAATTLLIRDALRLRAVPRVGLSDLFFAFAWTAAVLQMLLLFDPRYRDFPFATFAVPLMVVLARAALRDLPRGDGGREELAVGAVLVLGALASGVQEHVANLQAQAWSVCALLLALPLLLRVRRGFYRPISTSSTPSTTTSAPPISARDRVSRR